MNQNWAKRILPIVAVVTLALACSGCDEMDSPQAQQEARTEIRMAIRHNHGKPITLEQRSKIYAQVRNKHAIIGVAVTSIELLVFVTFGARTSFKIRKRIIEKRKERELYLARCERQRKSMEELYAPPPPPPEDPFELLKRRSAAIPHDQRSVSFFTSCPIPISEAIEITVLARYQPVVVRATREEALNLREGVEPLVRSLTIDGLTRPWYEWDGYDPYDSYWDAVAGGWLFPDSLVTAGWMDVNEVAPDLPGYFDRSKATLVNWAEATRRRSGVLYRWSKEKRPLIKSLNPSLAASVRLPRPIAKSKGVHGALDVLGLDMPRAVAKLSKARPDESAYSLGNRAALSPIERRQPSSDTLYSTKRLKKSLNMKASPALPLPAPDLADPAEPQAKRRRRKSLPSTLAAPSSTPDAVGAPAERSGRQRGKKAEEFPAPAAAEIGQWLSGMDTSFREALSAQVRRDAKPFPIAWAEQIKALHRELGETISETMAYADEDDEIEGSLPPQGNELPSSDGVSYAENAASTDTQELAHAVASIPEPSQESADLPGYDTRGALADIVAASANSEIVESNSVEQANSVEEEAGIAEAVAEEAGDIATATGEERRPRRMRFRIKRPASIDSDDTVGDFNAASSIVQNHEDLVDDPLVAHGSVTQESTLADYLSTSISEEAPTAAQPTEALHDTAPSEERRDDMPVAAGAASAATSIVDGQTASTETLPAADNALSKIKRGFRKALRNTTTTIIQQPLIQGDTQLAPPSDTWPRQGSVSRSGDARRSDLESHGSPAPARSPLGGGRQGEGRSAWSMRNRPVAEQGASSQQARPQLPAPAVRRSIEPQPSAPGEPPLSAPNTSSRIFPAERAGDARGVTSQVNAAGTASFGNWQDIPGESIDLEPSRISDPIPETAREPRAPARPPVAGNVDEATTRLVRSAPGASRMPPRRRRRRAAMEGAAQTGKPAEYEGSGGPARNRRAASPLDPALAAHIVANPHLQSELKDFLEDLVKRSSRGTGHDVTVDEILNEIAAVAALHRETEEAVL